MIILTRNQAITSREETLCAACITKHHLSVSANLVGPSLLV